MSNWNDVEMFNNKWGFFPNDISKLEKLTREQLIDICMCGMTVIAQENSFDIAEKRIKNNLISF